MIIIITVEVAWIQNKWKDLEPKRVCNSARNKTRINIGFDFQKCVSFAKHHWLQNKKNF